MEDVSLYLNFALYAILGSLREADALMRVEGTAIRSFAEHLTKERPFEPKALYRGMLLDPAQPFRTDHKLTFLSWSEDHSVAEWFACRHTVISEVVVQHFPAVRGHIITLPAPQRVLFHHSWGEGLASLALIHPFMGEEGARQIAWSLKTQSEVITENIPGLEPKLVADLDESTFARLEKRLTPPWLAHP